MAEYKNVPRPDDISTSIPMPDVSVNSRQSVVIPVPSMDSVSKPQINTKAVDVKKERVLVDQVPSESVSNIGTESKAVHFDKKVSAKKSMGVTVKKTKVDSNDVRRTVIKGIPRRIIQEMRTEFPQAENQTDLLMAWIFSHADGSWQGWMREFLTENQESLLANQDLLPFANMEKQLSVLTKKNDTLRRQLDQIVLLCSYLVYDRLGYRKEMIPATPEQIRFDEDGLLELMEHSALSSKSIFHEKRISDGRAIK